MLGLTVVAAWWIGRRYLVGVTPASRIAVGVIALAVLVIAEFVLGVMLLGASGAVGAFIHRDPVSGAAYYIAMVLFAIMPRPLGRAQRRRPG